MKKTVIVVSILLMALAGTSFAEDGPVLEPERVITQGEFAIPMARLIMSKEPEGGFTMDAAIEYLTGLGIVPAEGWQTGADLTEGDMVEIVRHIGIHLSTLDAELLVTVAKANPVFRRYERRFKTYILYKMNADNWTDSTILDEGDVTGIIPLSPDGSN